MNLVSASNNLKVHALSTGELVHQYQTKSNGSLRSISFSKDWCWLACVSNSGPTEIIAITDQLKPLYKVNNVKDATCAAFQHTTKKYLGIGTQKSSVLVYDVKFRKPTKEFRTPSSVTHVAFTAKDSHLIAACDNGDVVLFNNEVNTRSTTLNVPKSSSVSVIRPNIQKRHLLLGGSEEGITVCWDTNTSQVKFMMESHQAPVSDLTFSPINSDLVLTAGLDRKINLYDVDGHHCIKSLSMNNNIFAVDFSPDGSHFALGSQNGRILVYDARKMNLPVIVIQAHKEQSVNDLLFQKINPESNSVGSQLESDQMSASMEDTNGNEESFGNFTAMLSQEVNDSQKGEDGRDSFLEAVNQLGHSSVQDSHGRDSFLEALGLDHSLNESKAVEAHAEQDKLDIIPEIVETCPQDIASERNATPISSVRKIHERIEHGERKSQAFSTPVNLEPKSAGKNNFHDVSPVISSSNLELGSMIKKVVSEVVSEQLDSFKKDMMDCLNEQLQKVKEENAQNNFNQKCSNMHMYLNLVTMLMSKNNADEDKFNELINIHKSDCYHVKEITALKKYIAQLEAQIYYKYSD